MNSPITMTRGIFLKRYSVKNVYLIVTNAVICCTDNFLKTTQSPKSILVNIGLIAAGSLIFVLGMNTTPAPQNFLCGGLTGIALLLNYQFLFQISGFNIRDSFMGVSNFSESIATDIMWRFNRGVTFLDGEGGYSRQKRKSS